MIYFYTPWKRQKIFGFLTFSGAVEMQYSAKMGWLAETFWSVNFAQIFHKFAGCQTFHFHRAYRSSLNFTFNISVLKRMMVLRGPEITLRNEFSWWIYSSSWWLSEKFLRTKTWHRSYSRILSTYAKFPKN